MSDGAVMAAFLLWATGLVQAADVVPPHLAIADGAFVVKSKDFEVAVHDVGLPKPYAFDNRFRVCRVNVAWQGGKWVGTQRDGCHPNVAVSVQDAIDRSQIEVKRPPGRDRDLFEYWYVFPAVKGEAVRVFVRQSYESDLVLTTPDLTALAFDVKGRLFPEYPPAALTMDTEFTTCRARVDIAPSGVPGDLVVDGCDEVFRADLVENLRSWRFTPPALDSVPFWSAVTLGFTFTKPIDPGEAPTVTALFPRDPDLGANSVVRTTVPVDEQADAPEYPTWPALFVTNHRSFAEVRIHDVRWPEVAALDHDASCDVLFQVNSKLRVWAWAEACDEAIRAKVEDAAAHWLLVPGDIEKGERYARFRGTFFVPADGTHVKLRIPVDDLVTPANQLPEHIETYRVAKALVTVPPVLPRAFATSVLEPTVTCEYDVRVDPRGRPAEVAARTCPTDLDGYASKAIGKWRWTPAEADGKPIESRVVVRVRFDLGVKSTSDAG
jgi:hypothetical protein